MAGLVPALHVVDFIGAEIVDARHKAGHDKSMAVVGMVQP
jgi:hypothetical protein